MSNSTEEIDIWKRLATVEDDLLLIATKLCRAACATNYNLFFHHFTGEEREAYVERWKKEVETAMNQISQATTVAKALEIVSNFNEVFFDYIKAAKVDTADKAMEIAHSFIKKYSPVALPLKAERENDVWLVDIDVGALAVKVAKVKVDARTGDILSYEIPQK